VSARTLKLTISYDGTRLVGWQRQASGETVQGLLEAAVSSIEGRPVTVHGAGRTDAGVHALGQVASVAVSSALPADVLLRAINASLPADVRVVDVRDVESSFHARFSARLKVYRYLIRNDALVSPFEQRYVWQVPEPLDLEAMHVAAAALVGMHDFAAFQSAGGTSTTTVRTIEWSGVSVRTGSALLLPPGGADESAGVARASRLLVYEVCGSGFLRHMVRAIVGTLVDIGRGRYPPEHMAVLLDGGSRSDAGPTALFLVRVDYH
jgi:tRNA pseudouridine38-40 synthase